MKNLVHEIHDYVSTSARFLQEEYERIQKRAAEDPGTAGDQGEENWACILKQWLPSYFHIVTKGRIITDSGYVSPQIDLLVLSPSYPKILRDKKLYLSGGVVAAFECKITLKAEHISQSVETAAALKINLPKQEGTPYKELHCGIIFGLLAHSHSWSGKNSTPLNNIEKSLWNADREKVSHPRLSIDCITVSNLATWTNYKVAYISPLVGNISQNLGCGPNGSAITLFSRHATEDAHQKSYFSPIAALLSYLFSSLAWDFSDMRSMEEYFTKVNLRGIGSGKPRLWPITIYSEGIRERIYQARFSEGTKYDQWSAGFF